MPAAADGALAQAFTLNLLSAIIMCVTVVAFLQIRHSLPYTRQRFMARYPSFVPTRKLALARRRCMLPNSPPKASPDGQMTIKLHACKPSKAGRWIPRIGNVSWHLLLLLFASFIGGAHASCSDNHVNCPGWAGVGESRTNHHK